MSVISPWIFYAINALNKLSIILWIVGVALPACFFGYYCVVLLGLYIDVDEEIIEFKKKQKSNIKKVIIATIVCVLGIVAIPSEKTMYKMLVAKYVTYENIDKATESIKDGVDYIFEKLDKE